MLPNKDNGNSNTPSTQTVKQHSVGTPPAYDSVIGVSGDSVLPNKDDRSSSPLPSQSFCETEATKKGFKKTSEEDVDLIIL